MKRRALLKALPAIAVLPALAALPAMAEPETPTAALYREWERTTAAVRVPDEEFDRIAGIQTALKDGIVRMEPQNLRDLAMKLLHACQQWRVRSAARAILQRFGTI